MPPNVGTGGLRRPAASPCRRPSTRRTPRGRRCSSTNSIVRGDLLRRRLLLGVDGPEVLLGETGVARQVGERPLAGHQRALLRRERLELGDQVVVHLPGARPVGIAVRLVVGRVCRVEIAERGDDVLDVDLHVQRATSRRAGSACPRRRPRRWHDLDAVGHDDVGHVRLSTNCANHTSRLRPLSRIRSASAARRCRRGRLVAVDLRAGLRDRLDPQVLARDFWATSSSTVKVVSTTGRSSPSPFAALSAQPLRSRAAAVRIAATTTRFGIPKDYTDFGRPKASGAADRVTRTRVTARGGTGVGSIPSGVLRGRSLSVGPIAVARRIQRGVTDEASHDRMRRRVGSRPGRRSGC